MGRKFFGTDGIRGRVGEGAITPEFFLQLGWAVGKTLAAHKDHNKPSPGLVLIGKDTRISGYMFESALEAGLISAGADVGLLGPMPTPAIAYLTRTFQAAAGIVISASHNPFTDNGIKLFNTEGTKLSDELELAIEAQLQAQISTAQSLGKARRIGDAEGRYIEFCKASVPWGLSLNGLHLVLDCANGATYRVAPEVFKELGAQVDVIADEPDGLNINKDCGSTHLESLRERVLELGADLGIAFDGDGDRVMFVDAAGRTVDGDELLFIIARHQSLGGGGCSGVVGTLMSNFGLEKALQELDIPFARAKVGDRYVIETMKARGWQLGGESSGHIVCAGATTTGDGVISALQVLKALIDEGLSLSDVCAKLQKYPQKMVNVPVQGKVNLAEATELQAAVKAAEQRLSGRGRVLLRPSGTEPVVRVMVEGDDQPLVESLVAELSALVAETLA